MEAAETAVASPDAASSDSAASPALTSPTRQRSKPRMHVVPVVRATLALPPSLALTLTAAAASTEVTVPPVAVAADVAHSSSAASSESPVAAVSSPSVATPPRRLSGLRIHTISGTVLAGSIGEALTLLSPSVAAASTARNQDVPVATLQLPTLAATTPEQPSPSMALTSPVRSPSCSAALLQAKLTRAIEAATASSAAFSAAQSLSAASNAPLPQPQPVRRSLPPSKLQKPKPIVKLPLPPQPAAVVESTVAAVEPAAPSQSPRRTPSPSLRSASPAPPRVASLARTSSPRAASPAPSRSATNHNRNAAPSSIGSPPAPAESKRRRDSSPSPSLTRPTAASSARSSSPAPRQSPRQSPPSPASPRSNTARSPSPNRPFTPASRSKGLIPSSTPKSPQPKSAAVGPIKGKKRRLKVTAAGPVTTETDDAAETDDDVVPGEAEETTEAEEVDSEGEEVVEETEDEEEEDVTEEEEDDPAAEENSVPNRRPVDVLDALYEDAEHELEESLSELDRRAKRLAARRAAGAKTPEARKQKPVSTAANVSLTPSATSVAFSPSVAAKRIRLSAKLHRAASVASPSVEAAASSSASAASSSLLWEVPTPFDATFLSRYFNPSLHELNWSFGSNMNSARMTARKVQFEGMRGFSARLKGWQLCFAKTADSLGEQALLPGAIGYASLTPSADPDHHAYGVAYIVHKDRPSQPGGLTRLDEFEGVEQFMYFRKRVILEIQDGSLVEATAYLSCPGASSPYPYMLAPTRSYLDHLLAGTSLLPAFYVAMLNAWPLSWMPDPVAGVSKEQALLVSEPTKTEEMTEEQRKVVEAITKRLEEQKAALLYSPPPISSSSSSRAVAATPTTTVISSVAALRAKLSRAGFSPVASLNGRTPPAVSVASWSPAPEHVAPSSASLKHATLHRASMPSSRRSPHAALPVFKATVAGERTVLDSPSEKHRNGTRVALRLHPSADAVAAPLSASSPAILPSSSVLHSLEDSMPSVKPRAATSGGSSSGLDKDGLKRRMAKLQAHLQQQELLRAKLLLQQQQQHLSSPNAAVVR